MPLSEKGETRLLKGENGLVCKVRVHSPLSRVHCTPGYVVVLQGKKCKGEGMHIWSALSATDDYLEGALVKAPCACVLFPISAYELTCTVGPNQKVSSRCHAFQADLRETVRNTPGGVGRTCVKVTLHTRMMRKLGGWETDDRNANQGCMGVLDSLLAIEGARMRYA